MVHVKVVVKITDSLVVRNVTVSMVEAIAVLVEESHVKPFVLKQKQRKQHPLSTFWCTIASNLSSIDSNRNAAD